MIVRYFADVRALSGCSEENWTLAAPDLRTLLRGLAAAHGAAFTQRIFDGDRLSATLLVFINGRDIAHLRGLDSPLQADDVVAIFPMVAGG